MEAVWVSPTEQLEEEPLEVIYVMAPNAVKQENQIKSSVKKELYM